MLNAIDNKLNAKGDSNYFCFMPVIIANARIMTSQYVFAFFIYYFFVESKTGKCKEKDWELWFACVFEEWIFWQERKSTLQLLVKKLWFYSILYLINK